MDIIDFAKTREARLAKAAKEKAEPHARYRAMVEALDREDLTAMEYIAQNHALQMAYRIVEHSPCWGDKQRFLLAGLVITGSCGASAWGFDYSQ